MSVVDLPLDSIVVEGRTRKDLGDVEALAASIAELGLLQPIAVTPNRELVFGLRRLTACRKLGWQTVPARVLGTLEDALLAAKAERDENTQRKAYTPSEAVAVAGKVEALERPKAEARQADAGKRNLPTVSAGNFPPLTDTGRIRDKAAEVVGISGRSYEKAKAVVQAAEQDPVTFAPVLERMDRTGKVDPAFREVKRKEQERKWAEEAANRPAPACADQVHTCDALEGLAQLPDGCIQLVFTDPPYNLGVAYGDHCDDARPDEDYFAWCAQWQGECYRVLSDGGSAYFMHYPEVCARWLPVLKGFGFTLRRWLTWVYPCNVGQSPRNWTRAQRTILFLTKGDSYVFQGLADPQAFRNPSDARIQQLSLGGQPGVVPYDWWEYDLVKNVSAEKTEWPNQIPVALASRIVKTSSAPGDTVLDPFVGSGTTAVAAQAAGRRWIGFDLNPRSAVVTAQRIAAGGAS